MKRTKKNNKGFSLVELIVVVLIMAIIAVALAPQVMKWVGQSKVNTDQHTLESMKSDVQSAILEIQAEETQAVTEAINAEVKITNTGTTVSALNGSDVTKLSEALKKVVPGYESVVTKQEGYTATIKIEAGSITDSTYAEGTGTDTEG